MGSIKGPLADFDKFMPNIFVFLFSFNDEIFELFACTRLWPAFGRQSLVGSSGGYTSHGYTFHASPPAPPAHLPGKLQDVFAYGFALVEAEGRQAG